MTRTGLIGLLGVCGLVMGGMVVVGGSAQPEGEMPFPLPEGWTMADMQKCMIAGTPGERHAEMMELVGAWDGKGQMWMGPGMEPVDMSCVMEVEGIMDGRYIRFDFDGEMPGMGTFRGSGWTGYDNVAGQYQSTWIDNMSSGIMFGTGERSADGKTMTWDHRYTCPMREKQVSMRQVDTHLDADTWMQEMYGTDPKSGVEYKMMKFTYTRR